MKSCTRCGAELIEGANFCSSCGFNVVQFEIVSPLPKVSDQATNEVFGEKSEDPIDETPGNFTEPATAGKSLLNRVKGIMLKPKDEWYIIDKEPADKKKLLLGYVLILACIPAIAYVVLYGVIGITSWGVTSRSLETGIVKAMVQLLGALTGVYCYAWVIDRLAPSFESETNPGKSFQLASYSITPVWILGIFNLVNFLSSIVFFLGVFYSIYILKQGIPVLKNTPEDKVTGYLVISIISYVIIYFALNLILGGIFKLIF
ncbi:MAG: YIP1 family protein [Bacteroidales bacterium]|nr:YIP1 family protein [Bacteroidales bacterium]